MSTQRIKAMPLNCSLFTNPVGNNAWLLPADADSYERMVEQMATAVHLAKGVSRSAYISTLNEQRAALRAVGITAPKKGNK